MHCPRCGFDNPEDLPLLGRAVAQATSINFLFGCHAEARAELSAAITLYRSMVMTFWLPQAEAALAQVEGR